MLVTDSEVSRVGQAANPGPSTQDHGAPATVLCTCCDADEGSVRVVCVLSVCCLCVVCVLSVCRVCCLCVVCVLSVW